MSKSESSERGNTTTTASEARERERHSFGLFLSWLSPKTEEAGLRYERIRERLINYFRSQNCSRASELADETIDRVTRKIPRLIGDYKGNPQAYFFGVGRNVLREYRREPKHEDLPETMVQPSFGDIDDAKETESELLEHCLERLEKHEKRLILKYYEAGHCRRSRLRLSEEIGISPENLRVRAHRVRKKIEGRFLKHRRTIERG